MEYSIHPRKSNLRTENRHHRTHRDEYADVVQIETVVVVTIVDKSYIKRGTSVGVKVNHTLYVATAVTFRKQGVHKVGRIVACGGEAHRIVWHI